MKNLVEFINENKNLENNLVLEAKTKKDTKDDAKERIEEIKDDLAHSRLSDYVKTLDDVLKEMKRAPQLRKFLVSGFGGSLRDTELKMKKKSIEVSKLLPTQNEIDITKSLQYVLKWPEPNLKKYFSKNVILGEFPLVTFGGNWIIDGHHRWSQVVCVNPAAKMVCYDYDGAGLSAPVILKATQGCIAATIADPRTQNNGDNGQLPKAHVEGSDDADNNKPYGTSPFNIYNEDEYPEPEKFDKETLIKTKYADYIRKTAVPEFYELCRQYVNKNKESLKLKKELKDDDDCIWYLVNNLYLMRANNEIYQPGNTHAAGRASMPQTDNGGTASELDSNKMKSSAKPDKYGGSKRSALSRLDRGFDSDLV